MKTRSLVVVLGVLVAVGSAGWLLTRSSPAVSASTQHDRGTALAAPAPAPAAEACTFVPGERFAYRYELNSTISVPTLATRALDASMKATLGFEALRSTEKGTILSARFADVAHDLPNTPDAELVEPFLVELDTSCQLVGFARHRSTPLEAARRLQTFLWAMQFTRGEATTLAGQDGTGEYTAALTHEPTRVIRRITSYSRVWGSIHRDVPVASVLGVTFGASKYLASATLKEELSIDGTTTSSVITLAASNDAPSLPAVVEAEFVWENLLPRAVFTKRVAQRRTDPALLEAAAGLSLPQALEQFEARVATKGIEETWPALSAYFEVHPDQVVPALKKVEAGEVSPKAEALFFTALGGAGVDVAREALLSVMRNPSSAPMNRTRSMFALVGRQDVGVELGKELAANATHASSTSNGKFLATESALALSTLSGLQAEPALRKVANEAIVELLARPGEDGPGVRTALSAVGNTGDASLLPYVESMTRAESATVRMAATNAFRRMEPAASEPMALEWLRREQDPFVKENLYDVLRAQHLDAQTPPSPELVKQLLVDLPQTRSAVARKGMIRFLVRATGLQQPEMRTALVRLAKREHEEGTEALNEFTDVLTPAEVSEVLR